MNVVRSACIGVTVLLGSCASTSPRFHTLVPEPERNASGGPASGYRLEVESVRIPAQVDRLELVTRLPDGGIAIADGERWIAPVADELQEALAVGLRHRLGDADPADVKGPDLVSVRLNVERFESSPSRYALIEASWHIELKEAAKDLRVACRTRAYEEVKGGYPEMVRGYQRAVALIADQIASVVRKSFDGAGTECPAS